MLILKDDTDLETYQNEILSTAAIVTIEDRTKKMTERLEILHMQLKKANYKLHKQYNNVRVWQK